jgi:tetratricopeptide (TPR) repeat protein
MTQQPDRLPKVNRLLDTVSPRSGSDPEPAVEPTHVVINFRLLIGTAVILAILLPAAYGLHAFQIRRNAATLLAHAQRAQKSAEALAGKQVSAEVIRQKWSTAADYYQRYSKLRPDDLDGRIGFAKSRDRLAITPRQKKLTSDLYSQVLGRAPDNYELRRRQAELLFELGEFSRADAEAARVLVAKPHDAGCLRVRALVSYFVARAEGRQADWSKVGEAFENALAQRPDDIELALMLADLYRRVLAERDPQGFADRADMVIDRMVRAAPERADVLIARCRYRNRFALPGADSDLDQALKLAPRDPGVLFAAGERARRANQLDDARKYFEQLVEVSPYDRDGYLSLGRILVSTAELDEAQRLWERGLEKIGRDDLSLNFEAAKSLLASGRLSEAETRLTKMTSVLRTMAPKLSQAERTRMAATLDFLQGYLHTVRGRYLEAVPLLERVLVSFPTAEPNSPEATRRVQVLTRLGQCYSELEQWDRAAAAYQ